MDGAMSPSELLQHINRGNVRNADLLNEWVLHEKTLVETLRRMEGEGLIRRCPAPPRCKSAARELTSLSRELMDALHEPASWATRHARLLLSNLQVRRGVKLDERPSRPPSASAAGKRTPSQERWRNLGVALTMLRLRWSFPVIAGLRNGPLRPTDLALVVNEAIDRRVSGQRTLSDKVLWDTLHRLSADGVIIHEARGREFAGTTRCSLTDSGRELLTALVPMGRWAVQHEDEIIEALRSRHQGPGSEWTDHS
ncbi:winged helix-turn-helix transcriptional regulator [Streptomyces longispororuber]|nr:winged helix-turn-helix transcriptional regulator [Streptomyces longispororuber]